MKLIAIALCATVGCGLSSAFAAAERSPEDELLGKLPEIFAKSAEHYKALDAAATPLMKDEKGEVRIPHGWNKWRTGKDELDMRSIYWWTTGHYPGSLWYLYEATGEAFFKERATAWMETLAPVATYKDNHDVGFMMYCSYGNARRILKTDKYDAILMQTAATLCKRYHDGLGLIRSWGKTDAKADFLVIPDNLMNLELLEWAAKKSKKEKGKGKKDGGKWDGGVDFGTVAMSHADGTMKHHYRPDGGCYHVLDYDQETKQVKGIQRGQGASCETAWSRGQSWSIYGYTMMYRSTGYVRYLDFAKKLADYAIGHPNMPEDGIPCWDYGAPGEERDSSAGSCMASALLELSQYVGGADRARYRAFAVKQLLALASPEYFSEGGEIGHFLLKHGVGHKPGKSEIDTPLNYGDYYFLEALLRFRELKAREAKLAALVEKLPPKAALPPDEMAQRCRPGSDCADELLKAPIPETSDDLYGEFWMTGNRSHYQERFFARLKNLNALVKAEASEKKGRYLARVEDYLQAICDMKSWVLPAHDWSDGSRGTFRGTWLTADLFCSEVGACLACVLGAVGDRLDPALVARIKSECERRVLAPVRRDAMFRLDRGMCDESVSVTMHWWVDCGHNWNSVCWDNVVCCALGLLDDPVVGGKLQGTGAEFKAKVLSRKVADGGTGEVVLDLAAAYDVSTLKSLTRTFVYDRSARTFSVRDHVEFTAPTAFETPFNTYLKEANPTCAVNNGRAKVAWNVRPEVDVKGGAYELAEEDVPNPDRIAPHRVAVRFKEPVLSAEVTMTYRAGK